MAPAKSAPVEQTDEELMRAFKRGEVEAFTMLYERYSGRLMTYLRKRLHDDEAAQEVFQETFLKLYKSKTHFDGASLFAPWLFRICRNALIDFVRKRKLESYVAESPQNEPHMSVEDEDTPDFAAIIDSLTSREQEILKLRFERDLTFLKIAQTLGLSALNVRKIASRAINKLRGSNT